MDQPIVATSSTEGVEARLDKVAMWNSREDISVALEAHYRLRGLRWAGISPDLTLTNSTTGEGIAYLLTPGLWGPAVTPLIEATLYALLSDGVKLPRPSEIRAYLLAYPEIAELLPATSSGVKEIVGNDIELTLLVYHDPELRDEYLTLYVRPTTYDPVRIQAIDSLSSKFQDAIANRRGWLVITTDFRPRG